MAKAGKNGATNDKEGVEVAYDAMMHVPADATLYPTQKGEMPDVIKLTLHGAREVALYFKVLLVVSNRGETKTAYLGAFNA